MQVFKFGGASIQDSSAIKNVANIINEYKDEKLLIVVSALGKTTNQLEKILGFWWQNDVTNCKIEFEHLKKNHLTIINELELEMGCLDNLFSQIDSQIKIRPSHTFNFYYDQIVSVGELLSSKLLECFLVKNNINCILLDARNVIKTDDNYSDVAILWDETSNKINEFVLSQTENNKIILTQGFIGSTMQGNTTTLGREGSDYSASIFSFCLNAKKITIWKDVDGVMNADPKQFQHTVLIPKISYREAIEMTYYGAKVIHPKTIKPLQNKSIPLHVKSFLAPHNQGSIVCDFSEYISYPPVSVLKNNQTLISIQTRDFSFISEKHLQKIFENFAIHRIKINMMQNGAISFSCCVDWSTQLNTAITDLQFSFKVLINSNLQLITIRHYNEQTIHELTYDKEILLEQKTRQTIQFVLK